MIPTLTVLFFIAGLLIGSFLNVVIARYNTSRGLGGRSACMSCRNQLCWYELIPLFSFLGLRGRCRTCKIKISRFYPVVEFVTGLIFASLFLKFQDLFFISSLHFLTTFVYYAALFSILIVISAYDLRHKIIPDGLSALLAVLTFAGLFVFPPAMPISSFRIPEMLELISGLVVAIPFALLWLVSGGRWMGLGDAKLVVGLGYMLGLSRALSGVVMSFWAGAIVGVLLIILRKSNVKSEIPFAPFLVLGATLAFFFDIYLFPIL